MANPPLIFSLQEENSPRPFWSVMIPTFNARADYLEETLNSVLQKDLDPGQMQIEVIDDASPNGAPTEFIRKLAGKRVTVHCEPRNLELAGIWNRCIERARGEWVHILHQDDLVYPGFYEQLGGFNRDLKHALDWEMWIRIASKFPFFYEPKILACWRNHSGATTSRQIRTVVETGLS